MRIFMWLTIGFAAACGVCSYLGIHLIFAALIVLSLIFALVGVLAKNGRFLIPLSVGLIIGLFWFLRFDDSVLKPAREIDGQKFPTAITVTDYSYQTNYGIGFDGEVALADRTYRIRGYLHENRELKPGDQLFGEYEFFYTAPGAKQEILYHSGKGVYLIAYPASEITVSECDRIPSRFFAARLRNTIKTRLSQLLPDDVAAFSRALLLGDTTKLSYETETALKVSGIRHIAAVSGMHVMILYGLISMLTLRNRFGTALAAFPILFLFAALAGFSPSVCRASVMAGMMLLAQLLDHQYDPPTALAAASFVMLLVNPLVITSVGFQLSVSCVIGIQLFQPKISAWLKDHLGDSKGKSILARGKRWFISSVSVTLSTMIFTTPLCAYYFGMVSLIGVVTNLLTLWVVSFLFVGTGMLCLMSFASCKLASLCTVFVILPARYVLKTAELLSRFPVAALYTRDFYSVLWLIFVYILLAVFLLDKKKKPTVLISCAAVSLALVFALSRIESRLDACRVTMLDVGQGQSILLQSEGKAFLVDCGGDHDDEAADVAAETLLSQGINRLDGIIVTHGDRDHAGGVRNLLCRVSADCLFIPATTECDPFPVENEIRVSQDMSVTYDSTKITIFGPVFLEKENENSLCVLFETENCAILITGDRSSTGELVLLAQSELPKVTILVAGHHGSRYSTSDALLEAVRPEIVLISVGEDNPYGHPSEELLTRLAKYGCRVYRTDESGTIVIRR